MECLWVDGVNLYDQADVVRLASALSKATSLQEVDLGTLGVGYHDVSTLAPVAEALASLPSVTKIRVNIDAYGQPWSRVMGSGDDFLRPLFRIPTLQMLDLSIYGEGKPDKGHLLIIEQELERNSSLRKTGTHRGSMVYKVHEGVRFRGCSN